LPTTASLHRADDAAYDTPIFEVNGTPAARGCAKNGIVDGLVGMIHQHRNLNGASLCGEATRCCWQWH
jgi:hypothetical protein